MKIASDGINSEFIFHDFAAVTTDHGDCISVRTPANPDYFYGNFLIFPAPLQAGDLSRWQARFSEIFEPFPRIRHQCFQWLPDGMIGKGAVAELEAAGFTVDDVSVLTATSTKMDKPAATGVEFWPLRTDDEWLAAVDSQTVEGIPSIPPDEYRRFKEDSFSNYRAMSEAGLGDWWGAFKGETMVASLGLYFGRGIGRFQSVMTDPNHRRQGICRSMVNYVSNHAFSRHPGITLMLHADAGEPAERIYQSLGYVRTERIGSAFRPPVSG